MDKHTIKSQEAVAEAGSRAASRGHGEVQASRNDLSQPPVSVEGDEQVGAEGVPAHHGRHRDHHGRVGRRAPVDLVHVRRHEGRRENQRDDHDQ